MRLTINECNILRGVSISIVILHNYCHQITGAVKDNEFYYSAANHDAYMQSLCSINIVESFISYWGYLGVIVFVFLSGYGLSLKYDQQKSIDKTDFIWKHYKKLLIPLILGVIAYQVMFYAANDHLNGSILHTLAQSTALFNVIYPHGIYIFPGPYWYVGMAFELYVVYLLCIHGKVLIWPVMLAFLCVIFMVIAQNNNVLLIKWLRHNAIGWMVPFVFGVIMARNQVVIIKNKLLYLVGFFVWSFLLLIMDSNYITWMFLPIAAIMWMIFLVMIMPKWLNSMFLLLGQLSMIIYFVHPVIRYFVSPFLMPSGYMGLIVYVVITLLLSLVIEKSIFNSGCIMKMQNDN